MVIKLWQEYPCPSTIAYCPSTGSGADLIFISINVFPDNPIVICTEQ